MRFDRRLEVRMSHENGFGCPSPTRVGNLWVHYYRDQRFGHVGLFPVRVKRLLRALSGQDVSLL